MTHLTLIQKTLPQDLIVMQALLKKTNEELKIAKSKVQKCIQVAHDIRSPIPALKLISEKSTGLAEDEKELLDSSVKRVEQIADELLMDNDLKQQSNLIDLDLTFEPLLKSIRPIIAEKKAQCFDNKVILDLIIKTSPLNLKAMININAFQNSIANLIQNGIEAIPNNRRGVVEIVLRDDSENIYIDIIDNGNGIKKSDIQKVKKVGGSINKVNGNGLGLSGSIAVMKSFGGKLNITSSKLTGTSVTLSLPKKPSFNEGISLINNNLAA